MKKKILSFTFFVTNVIAFAQYEEFENWKTTTAKSLEGYETSAVANFITTGLSIQSTDKYSGNYAVRLAVSKFQNDTVFGYFLNGDPDNNKGGQEITLSTIDSIVGYYKCDIMSGDSAAIVCMPRSAGTPTGSNQVFYFKGKQATWKRFSFYVGATSVDTAIIAAAAGDPLNNFNGIDGSYILFDDIKLIGTGGTQDITNGGFENWSDVSWEEPDGWETAASFGALTSTSPVKKSSDSQSGMYAIELTTFIFDNDTIPGYATKKEAFTGTPTNIEFYYKYIPSGTDTSFVQIVLHQGGNVVGVYGNQFTALKNTYTKYTSAINPPASPDSVSITLYSGAKPGSVLKVDHIDFIFPVGISDFVDVERIVSYPNPVKDILNIRFNLKTNDNVTLNLIDVSGKRLESISLGTLSEGTYTETINTTEYSSGVYFLEFLLGKNRVMNKIVIE